MKVYDKVDPLAVLPIHRRLVENELVEVDELIAELHETHRRRPRLQQEFDRAGLPREGPR